MPTNFKSIDDISIHLTYRYSTFKYKEQVQGMRVSPET